MRRGGSISDPLPFAHFYCKKLTGCITVKIRYSNFDTHTQQLRISYTNSDRIITDKVMELFKKLYNRRMLIRLVGVRFSHLIHGAYQVDLFDDRLEDINLMQAMDRIRMRYGTQYFQRGICLPDEAIPTRGRHAVKYP